MQLLKWCFHLWSCSVCMYLMKLSASWKRTIWYFFFNFIHALNTPTFWWLYLGPCVWTIGKCGLSWLFHILSYLIDPLSICHSGGYRTVVSMFVRKMTVSQFLTDWDCPLYPHPCSVWLSIFSASGFMEETLWSCLA